MQTTLVDRVRVSGHGVCLKSMSMAVSPLLWKVSHPQLAITAAEKVCGTVSSMLSGLKIRSLGLNTLGTT